MIDFEKERKEILNSRKNGLPKPNEIVTPAGKIKVSGSQTEEPAKTKKTGKVKKIFNENTSKAPESPLTSKKLADDKASGKSFTNPESNQKTIANTSGGFLTNGKYEGNSVNGAPASGDIASNKEFAKQAVITGLSSYNKANAQTIDLILPDYLTLKPVQKAIDFYKTAGTENEEKLRAMSDTKEKEVGGQLVAGVVQAIPSLLLAIASRGGSLAANGTKLTAEMAANPTLISSLKTAVTKLGKNPMFWNSFSQIAGPTYEKEIANGATELQAQASAILNGVVGSAIEVGGGIEAFKPPKTIKEAAKNVLKTAGEEGLEEIEQYAVEGLANKAVGSDTAKWFSMNKDEDAVINPKAQLEAGKYGAAIGGILGVPQQFAGLRMNNQTNETDNTKVPTRTIGEPEGEVEEVQTVSDAKQTKTIGEPENEAQDIPYSTDDNVRTIGEPEREVQDIPYNDTVKTIGEPEGEVGDNVTSRIERIQNDILSMKNNNSRMSPETEAKIIDTVANRSGLQVRFVDDLGEDVNGYFNGNEIVISRKTKNPAFQVFKHELTHYLKGANEYDSFKNFILQEMEKRNPNMREEIVQLQKDYNNNPAVEAMLTLEDAEDEYVAKFSEKYLFNSEESIERLAREEPGLFQRIYEWIKDTIAKFGASENTKFLIDAQRKYERALRKVGNVQNDGMKKFSLNAFEDGKRFVDVDQDQEVFDNASPNEYTAIAKKIINDKFFNRIIGTDNKAFFNGKSRDEYLHPSKHIYDDTFEAKMRASSEIDNLMDAGTNFRNRADGEDGHFHNDVVNGFNYFDVLFKIGNRYFEGTINIKNNKKGQLFHDLTKIKDVTEDTLNSYGQNPKFQFLRTSSMDNLSQMNPKSNTSDKKKSYSIDAQPETDSEGNTLTREQEEYFKDSKIRDEEGKLKVVYHGSDEDFTVFDRAKGRANMDIQGMFFTPYEIEAQGYGANVKAYYLNITNPASEAITYRALNKYKGQNGAGIKAREDLIRHGYDGVDNEYDEFIAFYPEQIKLIENVKPTTDEDIRYSAGRDITEDAELLRTSEHLRGEKGNRFYDRVYSMPEEEPAEKAAPGTKKAERYEKRVVRNEYVKRMMQVLGADRFTDNSEIRSQANEIMQKIKKGSLSESDKRKYFDSLLYSAIREDSEFVNDAANIAGDIRNVRFIVDDNLKRNFTDFKAWKKAHPQFHFIEEGNVDKSDRPAVRIENWYAEESGMYPGLLSESVTSQSEGINSEGQYMSDADRLNALADIVDRYRDTSGRYKSVTEEWTDEDYEYAYDEFEKALGRLEDESNIIQRYLKKKVNRRFTAEEAQAHADEINALKKDVRYIRDKVVLDEEDDATVKALLNRELLPEDVERTRLNSNNILAVYEVEKKLADAKRAVRQIGEETRGKIRKEIEDLSSNASLWKDKGSGATRYRRETVERNFEDIMGNDAKDMIEYLATPVHENEAEATRFKNDIRNEIRKLNISSEAKYKVTDNTMLNPEWFKLSEETYESLKKQLEDNNGKMSESMLVQLKGEGLVEDGFIEAVGADVEKINKAVETIKGIYNQIYDGLNNVLVEYGYEPVEYRRNYFPHFEEDKPDSIFGKIAETLGFKVQKSALPTDIAGLTEMFKPGKKWFGHILHRTGPRTTYDALKGMDIYLEGAADVLYHTEDIQKWRQFETAVRTKFGQEGLKKEIADLKQRYLMGVITDQEYEALLNDKLNRGISSHGSLAIWIRDYTDTLAGKKSYSDRNLEKDLSRGIYDVSSQLEGKVAANMVGINPSSWLTNFIPLVQGGNVSYKDIAVGMAQTLHNHIKHDGVQDASTFLTNRFGTDKLSKTTKDNVIETLTSPMEIIDRFTSESIVRAKYNEGKRKGLSTYEAMKQADRFAADVIADRSKGAQPTIFNAKNPVYKIFTQFQIEVNNQWSHLFKDVPKTAENVGQLALAMTRIAVGSYLFNDIYEALVGRRPALDFISWINDFSKDATGYGIKNFVDVIKDAFDKDDDDEEEGLPFFIEQVDKKTGAGTMQTLGENIVQDIPFAGGLFEGGRLPISSALPDFGNIIEASADMVSGDKSIRKGINTIGNELLAPALYLLPPIGGGQIKKVYEVVKDIIKKGAYGMDNEGNEKLKFAVDNDPATWVKGLLFGQYAIGNSDLYVSSGFKQVSAKNTALYKGLVEEGIAPTQAEEIVRNLSLNIDQQAASIKKIEGSDYSVTEKNKVAKAAYPDLEIDFGKKSTVKYAELSKPEKETIDKIVKAGISKEDAINMKELTKGISGAKMQALALIDGKYEYLPEMKETFGISEENWNIARDAYRVGLYASDFKSMRKYAEGYDGSDPNTALNQKEVKAYLNDRDDLTNKQKYYAMRVLVKTADSNNPWYRYR